MVGNLTVWVCGLASPLTTYVNFDPLNLHVPQSPHLKRGIIIASNSQNHNEDSECLEEFLAHNKHYTCVKINELKSEWDYRTGFLKELMPGLSHRR